MELKGQILSWRENVGQNSWEHPLELEPSQSTLSTNVLLSAGRLGIKRPGHRAITLTGVVINGGNYIARYVPVAGMSGVPASDPAFETGANLIMVTATSTIVRGVPSAVDTINFVNVRIGFGASADAIVAYPWEISHVVLNGKFFIAFKSGVNRLHVIDAVVDPNTCRRCSLTAPAAPTVTNALAGTYPAVARWYCVAWREVVSGTIRRQSELSPATAFTPSGSNGAARIFKPTAIDEGEGPWVVYGSAQSANGPFYELTQRAPSDAFWDDTLDPATYDDGLYLLAPVLGSQTPFPSVKFLATDGQRLYGFGVWETAAGISVQPKPGRVYFSRVAGATPSGDSEEVIQSTIDQDDWIDLHTASLDRGIVGPVNGRVYCFQASGIHMLTATGAATQPVRKTTITTEYGALSNQSLVIAEDETGAACVYFLDPSDGPRRVTLGNQVQWVGKDIYKDVWQTVNTSANVRVAFGLYDRERKAVIWWVATGTSNEPNTIIVHFVTLGRTVSSSDVRGGWAQWTGAVGNMRHGCLFAIAAANGNLHLVPYACGNLQPLVRQDATLKTDFNNDFAALVQSKAVDITPITRRKRVMDCAIVAKAQAATTLRHTIRKDWDSGQERYEDLSLAPRAGEDRLKKDVESLDVADCTTFQIRIGDAAILPQAWELDRWAGTVEAQSGAK